LQILCGDRIVAWGNNSSGGGIYRRFFHFASITLVNKNIGEVSFNALLCFN
jgi:hypothetical protein